MFFAGVFFFFILSRLSFSSNIPLIVTFARFPSQAEYSLLKGFKGKIKYIYRFIPAVAVLVPEESLLEISNSPWVLRVEKDDPVYALDLELENSWGVRRIGAGGVHIEGNTGQGVKVAIIDTGIDYNHPELQKSYQGGYDFFNQDDEPLDDNGHGTQVAGVIAAENNEEGVVGVAPGVKLYALKVLGGTGTGNTSDVIAAVEWCIEEEIQIVNMSLGLKNSVEALRKVCEEAYESGVLLVAAAGNEGNEQGEGENILYPAAFNSVIAVGATDRNDRRADFSSTGKALEICAPGVDIFSTSSGGGYSLDSGTSFAAPHVAGVAALVISSGVAQDAPMVREILSATSEELGVGGWDTLYGWGLVNAWEATHYEGKKSHVESISLQINRQYSGSDLLVWARCEVVVSDENGETLSGAFVSGHWSGVVEGDFSDITDEEGKAFFESEKIKNPLSGTIFTFTVDKVGKQGYVFDRETGEVEDSVIFTDREYPLKRPFLYQNYPNPFTHTTTIRYDIPEGGRVFLKIYTLSGELVKTLVDEFQQEGSYQRVWDGRNESGREVARGIYLYILRVGNFVCSKKMAFLK
ncbi:S8 family serine peptidase [Candidatus Aerophobetes bacterium]|nr:S8 family serine peptidase [Candidatus Aerophobetes bacterium]